MDLSGRMIATTAAMSLAGLSSASGASAAIKAPAGVPISTRVADVPYPTNLTFDPAGGVWITSSSGVH